MSLTIFDHTFTEEPYDIMGTFTNQFGNLSAISLNAFKDTNGNAYELTVGASSNLILESSNATKNYTSSNGVEFFVTSIDNSNNRTDSQILNIRPSLIPGYTLLDTDNLSLDIDFSSVATLNTLYIKTSNATYDVIGTNKNSLVIDTELHTTAVSYIHEPVSINSNSYFNDHAFFSSNLTSFGHFFTKDVNFYRTSNLGSVEKTIGYGFRINNDNQLELVKVGKFTEGSNVSTVTKKVAIFGYNDISSSNEVSNIDQYLVFNEMEGIGTTDSNGNFTPVDTVDTSKLALAGGTMEGDINMNGFTISNAVLPGLTGYVSTSGDTMTGTLNMNSNSLLHVTDLQAQNLKTDQEDNIIHLYDHIVPATNGDLDLVYLGSASKSFDRVYATTMYTTGIVGNVDMNQHSISNGTTCTFDEFITSGADYAEYIEKQNASDQFSAGEVVGINSNGKVTKEFDTSLHFGIISDDAGIIGGKPDNTENSVIVSFCGRVPVKCSNVTEGLEGSHIVPVRSTDGKIMIKNVKLSALTLKQYVSSVGHVVKHVENDTWLVIVKH